VSQLGQHSLPHHRHPPSPVPAGRHPSGRLPTTITTLTQYAHAIAPRLTSKLHPKIAELPTTVLKPDTEQRQAVACTTQPTTRQVLSTKRMTRQDRDEPPCYAESANDRGALFTAKNPPPWLAMTRRAPSALTPETLRVRYRALGLTQAAFADTIGISRSMALKYCRPGAAIPLVVERALDRLELLAELAVLAKVAPGHHPRQGDLLELVDRHMGLPPRPRRGCSIPGKAKRPALAAAEPAQPAPAPLAAPSPPPPRPEPPARAVTLMQAPDGRLVVREDIGQGQGPPAWNRPI
jgi:transcriptional regulator with XRE-family HTH domain